MDNHDKLMKQREIIASGTLENFRGLVEFEQRRAGGSNPDFNNTVVSLVTMTFGLYGPIVQSSSNSMNWLVVNGHHTFLNAYLKGQSGVMMGGPHGNLTLRLGVTLDELDHEARRQGAILSRILRVGEFWASELPGKQIRVVFNVSLFENPSLFWAWVDSFIAEMRRQGFKQQSLTTLEDNSEIDIVQLKKLLLKGFNGEELDSLRFNMQFPEDITYGKGPNMKAQSLIEYAQRQARVFELIKAAKDANPGLDWNTVIKNY